MADRYWVGGTANWDATAGTKWALTSGGAGGQTVPGAFDDVYFDAASGAVTVTKTSVSSANNLNFSGFTGTFAGSSTTNVFGNLTVSASMTWTHSGSVSITGTSAATLSSNGKTLSSNLIIDKTSGGSVSLNDALSLSNTLTVTSGTFTTNNFNVTATQLSSSNSNTRTINLGSSTVTLSATALFLDFTTSTGLTFNAGTSQIVSTSTTGPTFSGGNNTFFNVIFSTNGNVTVRGSNTFNNFSDAGRTSAGIATITFEANQTINGTLTLSAGTDATMRTFVRSDTIGTTRTLTCAAFSGTDADFRDITIAGAAAPVSGTRLGDCKGNSGITFPATKTVYYATTGGGNWGATNAWSFTSGGSADPAAFPLSQDTVIVESAKPNTGSTVTINAAYNIGTIDMSARTSNTMTLATGSTAPQIYGNWINGTGTTISGTGRMTFAGRVSQTITSAGKTFTQPMTVDSLGGSVVLQDAFVCSNSGSGITLTAGTFDAVSYNVTFTGTGSGPYVASSNTNVRTLAFGSGTWTIAGSATVVSMLITNLAVTGTGTISLTSASAKTFAGSSVQTYPTLNQGGTGTLSVTGSNKFAGLTNTAIGRIQFTGGTTNEFTSFTINGVLGNLLQLGSTNTTQAILIKPSAWQMGLLSFDAGNNTGLNFLASDGTMNYLSVSYINGQVSTPSVTYAGNFFAFF